MILKRSVNSMEGYFSEWLEMLSRSTWVRMFLVEIWRGEVIISTGI